MMGSVILDFFEMMNVSSSLKEKGIKESQEIHKCEEDHNSFSWLMSEHYLPP